jgi:hypothetical protein
VKPRFGSFLPVTLAAAALAGCCCAPQPSYTKAEVEDHSVFLPSLRVVVPFSRQDRSGLEPQTGHALEARLTRVDGSGSQNLGSGSPIVIGDATYNAPANLKYDFDLANAEVAYRYRHLWRSGGVEGLVGIGYNRLRVAAAAPGLSSVYTDEALGPVLSVGGLWRLRPGTSVQGRVAAWYGNAFGGWYSDLLRAEIFYVQALGRNVALRAGYAAWQVDVDRDGKDSDIRLRFSGPALGLDLMF